MERNNRITSISVIIATRNRMDELRTTLDALAEVECQNLECQFIVVDNGSTDGTNEVLLEYEARLPLEHSVEPRPGKNRCLNRAMRIARGELLVFTDDDVTPDTDWLTSFARGAEEWPSDGIFCGRISLLFPEPTPLWIKNLAQPYRTYAYSDFDPHVPTGPTLRFPNGANLAVRRSLLNGVDYDESVGPAGNTYAMGSETELLHRLRGAGHRFIYLPTVHVQHRIRPDQLNLEWLAGRANRLGRGGARFPTRRFTIGRINWVILARLFLAWPTHLVTRFCPDSIRFWSVWHTNVCLGFISETYSHQK